MKRINYWIITPEYVNVGNVLRIPLVFYERFLAPASTGAFYLEWDAKPKQNPIFTGNKKFFLLHD